MSRGKRFVASVSLLLAMSMINSVLAQQPPPNANQCKSKWVLNPLQSMNFGGFAIEAGSGTITMNNLGGLSATGLISLSPSVPVTTFSANVGNSLGATCATYGFTLDWNVLPSPLTGPGTAIPLSNVRVSIPDYGLTDVTLPQTIAANPGNSIPFTMFLYGEIAVASPQTAGTYVSPTFTVDLIQSGTATPVSGTASATSFTPLSIIETIPMNFGTIAGGAIAGTVVLDTSGGRTPTGDIQVLASGPGNAASFQVSGEPNQAYTLVYGDGVLANASGQQIGLSAFTDNSSGTIPGTGSATFQVGATLNVGASQPVGLYSTANGGGSPYTVTINYN